MITTSRKSITDARSRVYSVTDSDHRDGHNLILTNLSTTDTAFMGGADVTASNGFPVGPGDTFVAGLFRGDELYGISASGTSAQVAVMVTGV